MRRSFILKKKISNWQFLGFAVTSFGGTILHFLYEWSGDNRIAAVFSGVNESTWEHMKLLFMPMFAFAIAESFFFKDVQCFWKIKLKGILLGMLLIPAIFYTYNGVIGRSPDWINIAIFFISAAAVYIYETKQFVNKPDLCKSKKTAFIILCLIFVLFAVFTFLTPELMIFKDPISGAYGI